MNRRNFFNKLSAAVAGVYFAVGIELKTTIQEVKATINPAWITAHYEIVFGNFESINIPSQVLPKEITGVGDKYVEGPEYNLICDKYNPGFDCEKRYNEFPPKDEIPKFINQINKIIG